ncbi:MAG: hypothetical protein SPK00_11355 [Corynebacterium glucuronolyticum]|nr:hypothetical protein [Mycobacteriaceae bacterium]MDY5835319.1 hypothetical protein [Corynebacterium glucuronolyticum]
MVIGLAYFGLTVGAGFASGQEVLQYYVSYGTWGLAAGLIVLLLMPITAMVILQYGSYFRATSHGKVFDNVTSAFTARFLDYTLTGSQFCLGFVMMAGAGSNLNQQFGLPLWVGSVIMALLVLAAGMLDVEKITNLVGGITPFMLLLILVAAVNAIMSGPGDLAHVSEIAQQSVDQPLPNWWLSALNYIGVAMPSGIAMAFIIGGNNWRPKEAGWGGFFGGVLFATILLIMAVALLFRVEDVADADLPTLLLITQVHPALGPIAAIATYLMIFSTCLSVMYSMGRRVSVGNQKAFRLRYAILVGIAFLFSFFPFTELVNKIFPIMGWLGIIMVFILLAAWLLSGRQDIYTEGRRRDKIRALILRKLDPEERFSSRDWMQLTTALRGSEIDAAELRDGLTEEAVQELHDDESSDFTKEDFDEAELWADASRRPLVKAEVRIVDEEMPE